MEQKIKGETKEKTKVGMYQKEEWLLFIILRIKLWISCTINLEVTK